MQCNCRLLYVTKKHYNLLHYHRIQCTVIDLIMKKYALILTYVTVPIKRTILMPIYRVFSKKSKLARQITDIKIIPAPLPSSCVWISIFLQLSEHYMSGRKLQGRYDKPCTDPFGPWSAQNTHITGCLDTSAALQSQYGNLRATPDRHLGNHTNVASKFGWQAAERDRECVYESVCVCVRERAKCTAVWKTES